MDPLVEIRLGGKGVADTGALPLAAAEMLRKLASVIGVGSVDAHLEFRGAGSAMHGHC